MCVEVGHLKGLQCCGIDLGITVVLVTMLMCR